MMHDFRNVFPMRAQRRHLYRDHLEPIEQILTKPSGIDLCFQIPIRAGDDFRVYSTEAVRSDLPDCFVLNQSEKLGLHRQRNLPNLVKKSDAIWVFGQISNGVLAEIQLAKSAAKPIRYFAIRESRHIVEVGKDEVEMEGDVKQFQNEL